MPVRHICNEALPLTHRIQGGLAGKEGHTNGDHKDYNHDILLQRHRRHAGHARVHKAAPRVVGHARVMLRDRLNKLPHEGT